jgi:nitronate monooxygenase
MAAALALGAARVWVETRFLASEETNFHPRYRERLLGACENDTIYLEYLFDGGAWTDAPARVLRNKTVAGWEAAGRPPKDQRPGKDEVVAVSASRGDIKRYVPTAPINDVEGVGLVKRIQPAAEIIREIDTEAKTILARLGQ